jgi:integrase
LRLTLWRELDRYAEQRLPCPADGIPRFEESTRRKGFFEQHEFEAVVKELGPDHADVITFAAFSGWRKSEYQNLVWDEVDLLGGVIKLSPERSKNDEGRTLPIIGPLVAVMERRMAERGKRGLPWVFTYAYGGKRVRVIYRKMGDWRKR